MKYATAILAMCLFALCADAQCYASRSYYAPRTYYASSSYCAPSYTYYDYGTYDYVPGYGRRYFPGGYSYYYDGTYWYRQGYAGRYYGEPYSTCAVEVPPPVTVVHVPQVQYVQTTSALDLSLASAEAARRAALLGGITINTAPAASVVPPPMPAATDQSADIRALTDAVKSLNAVVLNFDARLKAIEASKPK